MLSTDPPEPGAVHLPDGRLAGILRHPDGQLEPFGSIRFMELAEYFAHSAQLHRQQGASLLAAEALPSLGGCRAALFGARAAGLPIHITLKLEENGRSPFGSDPVAALASLQSLGAASFGLSADSDPSAAAQTMPLLFDYALIPLIPWPPRSGAVLLPAGDAPKMREGILTCGEDGVYILEDTCEFSEPVACELDMSDRILEVEDHSNNVLLVRVNTPDDAHSFSLNAHMARLPVAFSSDREDALEMALALFHGRVLIDSLCELPRALLESLAAQYGATVV